ncbi:class I SAM-dependent methyltransferase (plasmid) [Photobacterium sp. GJ3]|uniref:class I SAM-dependent methyltransferase n=1 Tax=Photobacterium sp. GJ3 TaxID=2829502 RepID=UPI001B8A8F6D|nr:class I SAM-dependent methyltransferase [Photobacterium sp. GJ3]QUJ69838.1 class I SAM-dependent methyltransferase [Photobacterium sp. GJ3]
MKNEELVMKNNIGETLLIPLYMKSRESKLNDPIICDTTACDLVDKLDYDFSKFDQAIASSVGIAIRSRYFDDKVKDFIENTENPVIVLLGAGLDSRYQRIGTIARQAVFYQLDIPEIIQVRAQLLPPHENETLIPSSMFETQWMDDLVKENPEGTFLFIVEGVLMYFERDTVKKWFQDMAERFPQSELLFDVVNVWLMKHSHRHDSLKLMNARFIYGSDDDGEAASWASNLEHVSTKLYGDFPEWNRVGWLKVLLMKLIPTMKYSGRMLHYRIK